METENSTPHLRHHPEANAVAILSRWNGSIQHAVVTMDQLQAIVQQAYDQHGILAQPDYAREAQR